MGIRELLEEAFAQEFGEPPPRRPLEPASARDVLLGLAELLDDQTRDRDPDPQRRSTPPT